MGKVLEIDDALWARLSTAARGKGKTPAGVVVDAAIGKEIRRSGYRETDAVRLVREYRKQLRRPARIQTLSAHLGKAVRTYRMWAERRLQLIISDEIKAEYVGVLASLGASAIRLQQFARRLEARTTVTLVRPPKTPYLSRDPPDNMFVAAAATGRARFLVTNDGDLLDIPMSALRPYRVRIVTPRQFLQLASELRR